tara:strand:- start:392 stop:1045 length:654 start_codon:yes stop_codon:yes gene_type:complete
MKKYTIDGDLAEETGIHVGDGSMNVYKNNKHYYTVACHHIDDKKYIDKVVLPLIKRIYGKTPKPRIWTKGAYGFRICSIDIIKFKNGILGLPLGKKKDISAPKVIRNDKKLMRRFTRGLFDTDGSLTLWKTNNKLYPRIYFSTISKTLVEEVKEFLMNEGFRVTYWETDYSHRGWSKYYKISINGTNMLIKYVNEIGFNNSKNIKKLDILGIKHKIF